MAKRRESLIVDQRHMTEAAGIMEIALGVKETGSLSSETRNRMMRMQKERIKNEYVKSYISGAYGYWSS